MTIGRRFAVTILAMLLSGGVRHAAAGEPKAPLPASPAPSSAVVELSEPVAPSAAAPVPEPPATKTPLALRPPPPPPLALEEPASSGGWWYKILLIGALGAGGWWLVRRGKKLRTEEPACSLRVVTRLSVGAKSEIVLVELEDQRLLLGVTPGSICRLEQLAPAQHPPDRVEAGDVTPSTEPAPARGGFGAALGQVERRLARYSPSSQVSPPPAESEPPDPDEEPSPPRNSASSRAPGGQQATGLLRLARKAR